MKKIIKINWSVVWVWLLALLLAVVLTKVYWGNAFPYTHDGANHLARFVNYAAALREGQFPPRFAPYIYSGYGFPIFNYNYPLANILALPWLAIGFHTERVFAILITSSLTVGIVAVFYSLRHYFKRSASVIGTLTYALSWYLNIGLVYRGGIGEVIAYALTPIVFWCLYRWQKKPQLYAWFLATFSLAVLLLAHNVMSLFSFGLLGLFSLNWLIDHRLTWRSWLLLWLVPVGLTLWFWLPALAEMNLVALAGDALQTETSQHVVPLSQLLFSPWRFGFSRTGSLKSLGFGQGSLFITVAFWAIVGLIQESWEWSWRRATWPSAQGRLRWILAVVLAGSFWLASDWSQIVWQTVSPLAVLQFPWRCLFITSLLLAPTAAWVYQRYTSGWIKLGLLVAVVWQMRWVINLKPVDYFHYDQQYYLQFPHSTTARNENRPLTFSPDAIVSWQPQPTVATGAATTNVLVWLGSRREYTVQVTTDAILTEPTVYFPGWQVKADDQLLTPELTPQLGGLVAYRLPARREPYLITSGFTGRTMARQWGEIISVLTAVSLLVALVWRGRRR